MIIKHLFIFTTIITVVNVITSDSNCFQSNQNIYQQIPNKNTMYIRSGVNNKIANDNVSSQMYNNRINGYTSIQSNQGNIPQQQQNRQYPIMNNGINRIMANNNLVSQYNQNQTYNNNNVNSRYLRGTGTISPMSRSMPRQNRQYHVMNNSINNTMLSNSNAMQQYKPNQIYNNNIASRYTSSPVGIQQPINSYQQQISNTQRYMAPVQYQQAYPQINNNRNNTLYR